MGFNSGFKGLILLLLIVFPKVSEIHIMGKEENLYPSIEARFAVLVDVVLPIKFSWKVTQGRCAQYFHTERLVVSVCMYTVRSISYLLLWFSLHITFCFCGHRMITKAYKPWTKWTFN